MQTLIDQLLWTDYHPFSVLGLPLGRRVVVATNAHGKRVVFSPLRAEPRTLSELKALGPIEAFVLASHYHDNFYEPYFSEFPESVFLAAEENRKVHAKWPMTALKEGEPRLQGFRWTLLRGMPRVNEYVFLHESTKTLIIADAFFNLPVSESFLERLWMGVADMGGRPRPSRLFRNAIQAPALLRASIDEVLSWDFDRIIGGHGNLIGSDGKRVLADAYQFLK